MKNQNYNIDLGGIEAMLMQDAADKAGIQAAIANQPQMKTPQVSPQLSQAAPQIAQAASGQLPKELMSYLGNVGEGAAPDYQAYANAFNQATNVGKRPAEEFNFKNVLGYLSDALQHASAQPAGGGFLSRLASGSAAANTKRDTAHAKSGEGKKELLTNLQKQAEGHRENTLKKAKAAREGKSQDITDALHIAQTEKAKRGPAGKGEKAPKVHSINSTTKNNLVKSVYSLFGADPGEENDLDPALMKQVVARTGELYRESGDALASPQEAFDEIVGNMENLQENVIKPGFLGFGKKTQRGLPKAAKEEKPVEKKPESVKTPQLKLAKDQVSSVQKSIDEARDQSDWNPEHAKANLKNAGWSDEQISKLKF